MNNHIAIKNFVRMCEDGWNQGWHERNGGNLSYRMTKTEVLDCIDKFDMSSDYKPLGISAPNMADEHFIVTGSGKYMRNVPLCPEENICIVRIDETGSMYKVVWGLTKGGKPTSELSSHILNHSVKAELTDGRYRVMYHAHPENVVSLSYVLPLNDKDFSRALWQSETECAMVFPEGVGVVGWYIPGGTELAEASSEKMKSYDAVVWAHHGLFCSGVDFDSTFGLMHTVEKAASIFVKVKCMGGAKQTITDEQLVRIAESIGEVLNPDFVDLGKEA
ncbi:MAG: rhamnulose-1-phosphate aldolase [Clostridia bacterium]|nr:rhamnulose-1-phosphate aldolase [Clostridia bacterium]